LLYGAFIDKSFSQELTRALALKEELASKLAANSNAISANLRQDYEDNVKQLESQIAQLAQEKENLMQALKAVQENNASNKYVSPPLEPPS